MSFIPNPSLVIQNSMAMVGALACVEFIREIPIYAAGKEVSAGRLLLVKLFIAVIVVTMILMVLFTFAPSERKNDGVSVRV